ncbi:MAG: alpha/beta hydrolase [Kofleriaceae bacterium]|nr:alpha/beta hydrolase [Kofleriaceae bacterium]MCL4223925.1 alpha/beta hydrolase [Myxococcales bacterium]
MSHRRRHRRRAAASALPALLWAVACGPATTSAPPPGPPAPTPAPPPAPAERKLDGGRLLITVGGQPAGAEGFELRQVGDELVLETHMDATLFGSAVRGRTAIRTDLAGRPRRGEVVVDVGGVAVVSTLAGGPDAAVVTVKTGDAAAKEQRAAGPIDLYLDSTSFAHLALLCRAEATQVTAFPGLVITLGKVRTAGDVRAVSLSLAGQLQADLYCAGPSFLGADIALLSLAITREGDEARIAPLRVRPREKPPVPEGLVELERTVEVAAAPGIEPARLACSLMLPASHAAVTKRTKAGATRALPAVTFITGSGLQDRDEDSYGPGGLKMSIFKTIAIRLAQAGIASLRCDDRGGGGSSGDFAAATLATFAADAAAVLTALRREPAIDPARTGIIGHSEGGIVAPLVTLRLTPRPRALVLMAGTGRPFDVIIQEQARRGLERAGMPAAEVEAALATRQRVYDALRAGQPLPAELDEAERKAYGDGQAWIVSHLRHDPAATAARVKGVAVLIAQGELDQQVAVADADALAAALRKGNKVVEKLVYPGLNHLFVATTTGDLAEYTDPDAQIDERFLADVVRFLAKHL